MTSSPRFQSALAIFAAAHATDPAGDSAAYHSTLAVFATKLCRLSDLPELQSGPSEALLLACASQHIRRWERPRKDAPEGLSGYKMWRTGLNRFHTDVAHAAMVEAGYSPELDEQLFTRVRDLLLKRTLARPPHPVPLKDPEMHLFESAICLTFLSLEFKLFSDQLADTDKMVDIVKKTWAKMEPVGQGVVANELLPGLSAELTAVVMRALE